MPLPEAANINGLWAALLIEELRRCGVRHVVVSPGSRSTPLTLAAASTPGIEAHAHFDERGAAFYALGLARAHLQPAALICTSGSAAANYLPALVEAAASCVPLIVLTADRPPELLHTGANQAIDQPGLFAKYVRWEQTLPCPTTEIPARFLLTTVDQACHAAMRAPAGPVHLNCMFREPLAPVPSGCDFSGYLADVAAWRDGVGPYTKYYPARGFMDSEQEREVVNHAHFAKIGVLVIGQLDDPLEIHAARVLAEAMPWPVLPDVLSSVRVAPGGHELAACYDHLMLSERFRAHFNPDVVFHIGGAITSKRLNEFLAARRPKYVHIAPHGLRRDPGHIVTHRVEADLRAFCGWLTAWVRGRGDKALLAPLLGLSRLAGDAIDAWLAAHDALAEMHVARIVSRAAPPGSLVFLGNSMPVRDFDMYADSACAAGRIMANRGASGIDGNLATALGAARALGQPLTAIVGDLTALHDLNSLALVRAAGVPVVIVVVNNDGGGIFSFLPVREHAGGAFEPWFGTPHGFGFAQAAAMFGLRHAAPRTAAAFQQIYAEAMASGAPTLIEVATNREDNVRQHRALQSHVASVVDAAITAHAG